MVTNKIWLIGASQMAVDYAAVLKSLNADFLVIGRSAGSAANFEEKTSVKPLIGGLDSFLVTNPQQPYAVIIAVGIEELKSVTSSVILYGAKHILIEKPGGLNLNEIKEIDRLAKTYLAKVFIGYNRRFFSSVIKSKEIIEEDGGVLSFNFEFTEWGHVIDGLSVKSSVKSAWFLSNSSHVIDLAFYLGGQPTKLTSYTAGECDWHKPTIFSGAGVTEKGALFSYIANWQSPGRWGVEVVTAKHRLIFRPMEMLQIQIIGSVQTEFVEIDDDLDKKYKPGLYLQTTDFLEGTETNLCTISEQLNAVRNHYSIICG
jgi:predicted dehydrogenase